MPPLSNISYSQEETITAIRSYYEFLTTLYLPNSAIIEPPPDGWPNITHSRMEPMGKNHRVIELLRHLPYIEEPKDDTDRKQAAPYTYMADYQDSSLDYYLRSGKGNDLKIITEGAAAYENTSAHVVGLTIGGRDSPFYLLDTKLGVVHWAECPRGPRQHPWREPVTDDVESFAPLEEVEWRSEAPAWAIKDFFEVLKEEFRALRFVPLDEQTVLDVYTIPSSQTEGLVPLLQNIFREHGWPDSRVFRREACLEAVRKALEENYPEYAS
ncbi:unnamed protein product [Periconia digitata]|uniref:Uncharacterized protein n=1 Tax=Periconia digitata TaxID=1303443 RepID=A0A9W4U188_9PLEO|nr:unnamed protein product [Periconia digitata]